METLPALQGNGFFRIFSSFVTNERQTNDFRTLVEKLPSFIKQAKNRDAILKAIERLEKTF